MMKKIKKLKDRGEDGNAPLMSFKVWLIKITQLILHYFIHNLTKLTVRTVILKSPLKGNCFHPLQFFNILIHTLMLKHIINPEHFLLQMPDSAVCKLLELNTIWVCGAPVLCAPLQSPDLPDWPLRSEPNTSFAQWKSRLIITEGHVTEKKTLFRTLDKDFKNIILFHTKTLHIVKQQEGHPIMHLTDADGDANTEQSYRSP